MATHEEFVDFLAGEVDRGGMRTAQVVDLLVQKAHYDANRRAIESKHHGKFVGFTKGRMHVATALDKVLAHGSRGHLVYFERAGMSM